MEKSIGENQARHKFQREPSFLKIKPSTINLCDFPTIGCIVENRMICFRKNTKILGNMGIFSYIRYSNGGYIKIRNYEQ